MTKIELYILKRIGFDIILRKTAPYSGFNSSLVDKSKKSNKEATSSVFDVTFEL